MNTRIDEQVDKKNFDLKLWQNLLHFARPHRRLMIILGLVMLATAAVDTALPLFTKHAIDHMIVPRVYDGITGFALLYVGAVLLQMVLVYLLIDIAGRVETGMNKDLRNTVYRKLQMMSFSYYDRTPTGWLVARLTSDISRLGDVIAWGIVDLVWGLALMIGISGVIFYLNWKLALLVISLIPLMAWISTKFHIRILRSFRLVRRFNSQITNSFSEGIHGAKTTKTLVREAANLDEFEDHNRQMYRHSRRAIIISALFMPTILVISSLGTGLVIWIGGSMQIARVISYGTLVAFIAYTLQFFEPISQVARIFAEMQNAQAAGERVFSLLNLTPEISDEVELCSKWKQRRMTGEISIEDISFAYKEGKPVFTDFSLHIPAGESLALVGETGTGKTTLVNLICRFYEPQQGKIRIDTVPYQDVPMRWIHSQLGYVQQVPHLFQGTILENIRYGRLDASDEEVIDAAKAVYADDFIQNLPENYQYQVGESGNLLSTGQKQLIAFARVVLVDPALLILDEATASIDTETEQLVQSATAKLLKGRTSIIIAHRLSTIRQVDRILLMHKGMIIEQGDHPSLMKLRGRYYNLYINQFMQEIADQEFAKEAGSFSAHSMFSFGGAENLLDS